MNNRLDWYTTRICPSGQQEMHIVPVTAPNEIVYLDEGRSALLQAILNSCAQDRKLDFGQAKQAVLAAFYKTARSAPQPA